MTIWLFMETIVFLAKVCNMKPLISPKHMEDVLDFGDKWKKVKNIWCSDEETQEK